MNETEYLENLIPKASYRQPRCRRPAQEPDLRPGLIPATRKERAQTELVFVGSCKPDPTSPGTGTYRTMTIR